jgi:hypothetical protein
MLFVNQAPNFLAGRLKRIFIWNSFRARTLQRRERSGPL